MSEKNKLEFRLQTDDWETFIERVEIWMSAKDIKDNKKAVTLLTMLDEDAFVLIRNLCSSNKPITKSYDELKTLMENHLSSKLWELMKRCLFNQAKQEESEFFSKFAARLRWPYT